MADLDSMSLAELKKYAKGRGIKQYYIMKKSDLVELLKMPELPLKFRIEKMTITELREMAKERKLRGFWGLPKNDLIRILFPEDYKIDDASSSKENDNDGKTCKHENPEDKNAKNIGIELLENS